MDASSVKQVGKSLGDLSVHFFDMVDQSKQNFQQSMEIFIMAPWDIWKQNSGYIFDNEQSILFSWKNGFSDDVLLQTHRMGDTSKILVMAWLDSLA